MKFGDFYQIRHIARLKTLLKFSTIPYLPMILYHMYMYMHMHVLL